VLSAHAVQADWKEATVALSRRMRLVWVVALWTGVAVMSLPTGAQGARSTCAARGSATLDATEHVRLYRAADGERYVCAYANGRRYDLNRAARGSGERMADGPAVVAGRYVAFTVSYYGPDYVNDRVFVRNVTRGRWLHEDEGAAAEEPGLSGTGHAEISSLVADRRGSAAWTVIYDTNTGARQQVVSLVRGGQPTLLDVEGGSLESDQIDLNSLALVDGRSAARVYWMHGDTPRTARLR
jgi:hypothetical protein